MQGVSFYTILGDNLGVALDALALHNNSLSREEDPENLYELFFNWAVWKWKKGKY